MKHDRWNIEPAIFWPTILIFAAVSVGLFVGGDTLFTVLSSLLQTLTTRLGWVYLWIYIINFIFLGWLAFSKYGSIKFGAPDEKPEYSNFSWTCMVFTTGIDASIMIMSLFEPIQYVSAPPFGLEPFSAEAYDYAHMYGQFHWGPSAWTMYIPATIAIAYTLFVKRTDTTRISNACVPASGWLERHLWARHLLDVIIVFGIMGGIGASIGLEIPVISRIFHQLTGVADTLGLKFIMLAALLVLFGSCVYLGLEKGRYLLLSAHREENIDTEKNFTDLFTSINHLAEMYDMPILYSCHPRSRKFLQQRGFVLDKRVRLHEPLGFHDYNHLQMNAFCVVSDSGTLPEESSFFTSVGHPFPAVCIRTSTERPEALDKGCFILAGIAAGGVEQAVETAVAMNENGDLGIPVPYYTEDVSTKVVKIIQSYVGVVNKMVWRKG